jgi:hypothetical protein
MRVPTANSPGPASWTLPASTICFPPMSPKPTVCIEKHRLMDSFREAIKQLIQLEQAETEAIDNSEQRPEKFDRAEAWEQYERAKSAYILHVEEHGC